MNTKYKICLALTVLDWILVPVIILMIVLEFILALSINTTYDPTTGDIISSNYWIITVVSILFSLAIVAIEIACLVLSIMIIVKNDSTSPNSGLTLAVGICGIVFPPANLIMGIMLCGKLKDEAHGNAGATGPTVY